MALHWFQGRYMVDFLCKTHNFVGRTVTLIQFHKLGLAIDCPQILQAVQMVRINVLSVIPQNGFLAWKHTV